MSKFFLETVNGCRFFSDHYLKVRRYRESRGLTTMKDFMFPDNGRIIDHPLIDKEFEKFIKYKSSLNTDKNKYVEKDMTASIN